MARLDDSYTRYRRPILWLVRGGETRIDDPRGGLAPTRVEVEPFYLSKSPVTNEQFEEFSPAFERSSRSPDDRDAALGVSWEEAAGYCAWYATVSRKPMRLPTEIEWEHACRGGTETRYFWGDDPAAAAAWCGVRPAERVPHWEVLATNPSGLHAMLGCAWEWTASPANPDAADAPAAERMLRGGSILEAIEDLGCGVRRAEAPDRRIDLAGFRLARSFR